MGRKARWLEIHDELFMQQARTGERVEALACKLAARQEERIAALESAVRTYLLAVDEESGQAIALEALRKALEVSDA